MGNTLRDFIKDLRSCKTASEERALISKEIAEILSSLQMPVSSSFSFLRSSTSGSQTYLSSKSATSFCNIQKLLYIFLLGQSVNFGQIECLKLCASSHLFDKKLGYLGVNLLIDNSQETLLLATNSLKKYYFTTLI